MCCRFVERLTEDDINELLDFIPYDYARQEHYNVAPTQKAGVLRIDEEGRIAYSRLRWGLVPAWADDVKLGSRLINARAETARDKPSFRDALRHRRCLVPVAGFYEWTGPAGHKQPYYLHPATGPGWLLAGLWETNTKATGERLDTFTLLTVAANRTVAAIHDRMPAILTGDTWRTWLDAKNPAEAAALLRPCPDAHVALHPVSPRVNSPRPDDAHLLDRIDEQPRLL